MATEVLEKAAAVSRQGDELDQGARHLAEQPAEQPITGLLNEITDLDENKVILIGRTLTQASAFNEVVRSQVAQMNVGEALRRRSPTASTRSATMPRAWSTSSMTASST